MTYSRGVGGSAYPWQVPFVADVEPVDRERHGVWDAYRPPTRAGVKTAAVVFVHGGPLPPGLPVPTKDWPLYQGYATLAARAGLVAATLDHGLHGPEDYATAFDDVRTVIDAVRNDTAVDPDRIAVWAFSGGAPLVSPLLRERPNWLRTVAFTYPMLVDVPNYPLPPDFRAIEALTSSTVPIILTRVGREAPEVAAGVVRFLNRAAEIGADVTMIDVPEGQHGFDALPAVPGAVEAVHAAVAAVRATLTDRRARHDQQSP